MPSKCLWDCSPDTPRTDSWWRGGYNAIWEYGKTYQNGYGDPIDGPPPVE